MRRLARTPSPEPTRSSKRGPYFAASEPFSPLTHLHRVPVEASHSNFSSPSDGPYRGLRSFDLDAPFPPSAVRAEAAGSVTTLPARRSNALAAFAHPVDLDGGAAGCFASRSTLRPGALVASFHAEPIDGGQLAASFHSPRIDGGSWLPP